MFRVYYTPYTIFMDDRDEKLKIIRDEVLRLTISPLYAYRCDNNYVPVIGQGNHHAAIMFIGEAPGKNEAQQGRPFCGAAGKILDQLLASVHIKREDVYITNIVKDRPPQNRDPEPAEIKLYGPFLDRQIAIIQPRVIVTLGRFSMVYLMNRYGLDTLKPIGQLHGTVQKPHPLENETYAPIIIPLYHPAAALYNGVTKEILFKDFQQLQSFI